eukprot:5203996-Pyramimonas_sp.AAC.1
MPLLGKPNGGNRLIILSAGMYRIWQRARRAIVQRMHNTLDRGYWGACKGRSAIDCAWAQAV